MLGMPKKGTDHVVVRKIDNGYLIETCCVDEQSTEYVKTMSKIPAVLDRILNLKGKKSKEDYEKMKREESVEKTDDGKFNVKIKLTD